MLIIKQQKLDNVLALAWVRVLNRNFSVKKKKRERDILSHKYIILIHVHRYFVGKWKHIIGPQKSCIISALLDRAVVLNEDDQ